MAFTLLDTVRAPISSLLALNADGTTLMDLTAFMNTFDASFTDELESNRATFVLCNPNGIFDKLGGLYSTVLSEGRIIKYQKGFVDLVDGTRHLYPSFYGKIGAGGATYQREEDETVSIVVFDLMRQLLSQKVTTQQWTNTQYNIIASDIYKQYTKYTVTDFAPLNYPATADPSVVQFPDYSLGDIFKTLFDVPMYWVWTDYQGRLATRPRIGSQNSAAPGLIGYPDATSPPDPSIVDFTFPDATLIESITPDWADYEFINQVKVLGIGLASQVTLGPSQLLVNLNDQSDMGFLAARDGFNKRLYFSDQTGSNNAITATNIYVKIYTPSHDGTGALGPFYMVREAGAVNPDTGIPFLAPSPEQDGHSPGTPVTRIQKDSGKQEGGLSIIEQTSQYVNIFGYANSDGGGFLYAVEVWGQPLITTEQELTTIVDYNPVTVTSETLTDAFGDHTTFQAAHNPIGKGTPVAVTVNSGAGDVALGTVSADGVYTSDQIKVDFERGRVVLRNPTYKALSADAYFTGGTAVSNSDTIDVSHTMFPVANAAYNTYRRCAQGASSQFSYLFTGLDVGRGYNVRLHFSDPTSTASGQRKFNVYINSGKVADGLDVYASINGKDRAYVLEIDGVTPTITGQMNIEFRSESNPGEPFCCAIEVLLPQGQGASPFAVNCGGAAYAPATIPVVKASYAYSPIQEVYGIQNQEVNNPLLQNVSQTQATGQYTLNYSAWSRNRITLVTASIPTLTPTMVIKFFHPRLGVNGSDVWAYVKTIARHTERPTPDDDTGSCDNDTYYVYILYIQAR